MGKIEVTLMNKDRPVMYLSGELKPASDKSRISAFVAEKAKFDAENKKFLPVIINKEEIMIKTFNEWFRKRIISDRRMDVPDTPIDWRDGLPHYFSLSDQYWLRYNENETYKDLNFFTNGYKLLTGDTLFTKNKGVLNPAQMYYHSPDVTTNGIMKKRWKRDKNGIDILIKHSSNELKHEVLNEILATKLLERLKMIPFVSYYMCIEGYDMCSMCRNFVTQDTEFVPSYHIFSAAPYSEETLNLPEAQKTYAHLAEAIDYFKIPGALEFIDKMLIVDCMMMNDDRHLGNFGFLRNVNTGEFIEPAPLFDFGSAFFKDSIKTNKNKSLFADRINYLFDNKSMQPLTKQTLSQFKKSIKEFSFVSNTDRNRIIDELEENNKKVRDELLKHESVSKEKNKDEIDDF